MTPQYIMRQSLCREPHCAGADYRQRAESEIECLRWAAEYAEPGYSNPVKSILFANWNYFPRGLDTILERAGYEIEWSDEWTMCDCCNRALRTSPNGYNWQPSFIATEDGETYCFDCRTETDIEAMEDNPRRAVNLRGVDLTKYGYHELQCGYESGWHRGMNADPKAIYAEFVAHGHKRLLFQIDGVSQFYITFCIWEKDAG